MTFDAEQAKGLLDRAVARGASEGDVLFAEGETFSAQVRLKEVEKISSAKSKGLGLRLFFGKRSAIVSTSDLSPPALSRLVDDACALAACAEEDSFSGLPERSACATTFPSLDLTDPEIGRLTLDEKIDLARRAETAALDFDPRLTNSEGGDFSHSDATVLYVTSGGFVGSYSAAHASLSVSPIASAGGQMQRDYWYSSGRKLSHLERPESVGQTAARRTLRRLGARQVPTQQVPVIFDSETAASLIGHLASAISGYALYKKASFLIDQLGEIIAAPEVTIIDDPTLPSGLGSRPFDGEGLPSTKRTIVERGRLSSYLLDTYSGKKIGLPSTGHAARGTADAPSVGATHFYLAPGPHTPEEIIASVKTGLYVTDLIGFGVNGVTGDYSRGVCGIWIENGELTYPVEEVTIAGSLRDMFRQIEMIGADLNLSRSLAAPTLKISQMTVAGG
jgi:PmbA protein